MKYFNIFEITYEGDIVAPLPVGAHTQMIDIIPVFSPQEERGVVHLRVYVAMEYFINGNFIYKFVVTTTYLITGFNYKDEKEEKFLRMLIVRAFGNLQAILGAKYQDAKTHIHIPDDPNYESAFKEMIDRLNEIRASGKFS